MAAPSRPESKKKSEYEERPDWGTVFQRPGALGGQPNFTGVGILSAETLKEINAADGECQISLWTLDKDGKPLKNRNGTRRFRLHIEPPYDNNGNNGNGSQPDASKDDDDNIPF